MGGTCPHSECVYVSVNAEGDMAELGSRRTQSEQADEPNETPKQQE